MTSQQEFDEFRKEFEHETDRAAVILGAAKLDELLRLAIIKRLAPSPSSRDTLLEPEGPLGTFSARIDMSFRLRLIDEAFARVLHLIRRTRNDFAHESTGASLASGSHADRVKELALPWRKILEQMKDLKPESKWRSPCGQFEFMLNYSLVRLNQIVKHCDEVAPLKDPLGIFMEPVREPNE